MQWIRSTLLATLAFQPVSAGQAYDQLYRLYDYPKTLDRDAVPVCFHHGCESVKRVSLSDEHWRKLAGQFEPPAQDPAQDVRISPCPGPRL